MYCVNALASWSGQDVGLNPHLMPDILFIASSISMPSISAATPCVLPEQPPSKCTLVTLLSTTSKSIEREHTLQQLKAAGIIEVSRGTGGVTITRPLDEITFLDIYKAVECAPDEQLFHFHENPNQQCPVGKNIHRVLDDRLLQVQKAMEDKLAQMTLADVKNDVTMCIEK